MSNPYHDIDIPAKEVLRVINGTEDRISAVLRTVREMRVPLDQVEHDLMQAAWSLEQARLDYHDRIYPNG